jgi:hypothetical protein
MLICRSSCKQLLFSALVFVLSLLSARVVLAQGAATNTVTVPPAVVSTQEEIFGAIGICAAILLVTYFIRLRQSKNNSGPGGYE